MKLAAKIEPNCKKLRSLVLQGWKCIEVYTNQSLLCSPGAAGLLKSYSGQVEYVVHAPTDFFDYAVINFADYIGAKTINTHKIISNTHLANLVNYAGDYGITVTIENEAFPESHHLDKHGNPLPTVKTYDPIRSGGDFLRLVELIPNVRLCVDVEHALIRKEYPCIISSCAQYLAHIHLCGYNGGAHHRPVYENMDLVKEVVKRLRECGYKGFVVCEHDTVFHEAEIWKKTLQECLPLFGE